MAMIGARLTILFVYLLMDVIQDFLLRLNIRGFEMERNITECPRDATINDLFAAGFIKPRESINIILFSRVNFMQKAEKQIVDVLTRMYGFSGG